MKTIYDSNYSNKYIILFDEAYTVLKEAGKLRDEDNVEGGKIESLEHYFSYIGDLVDLHTANVAGIQDNENYSKYSKFLMLPMDEIYGKNVFSINPDSRVIDVPASFKSNGVSVTGDLLAETLLFEIDRFYDITDLASTEIYVQWINPADKMGASKITIVDYESKPGKLVFGWPLTDKITVEGKNPLKFSVRFIKHGDNNEIIYTLNTMATSVKINQALFTAWDESVEIENANEMLDKAITNGPIGDGTEPLVPTYVIDLTGGAMELNGENKAELQVAVVTGDNGTVTYSWFYAPKYIEDNKIVSDDYISIPSEMDYIETADTNFIDKKVYYTKQDNAYVPYDNTNGWIDGLFEKVSVCKIDWAEGEHITGEYYVNTTNKIGSRTTNKVRSKSAIFNCPEKVEFNKNLASDIFMTDNAARLEVNAKSTPDNAAISYEWFAIDSEGVAMKVADGSAYQATNAGWYKSIAYATLNKETMFIESDICRVLNDIQAPIITFPAGEATEDIQADENGVFELKVEYELSTDKLISDSVEFNWFHKGLDDEDYKAVSIEDDGIISITDNVLKFKPTNSPLQADLFYCVITNKLANKKASAQSGIFQVL